MKDILLAASICLGACSTVVPGTVLKLQGVDPLTADPADIALRVDLPDSVALLPEAGTLDLRATLRDGSELSGSFPIEQRGDVLRVAQAAQSDLRALQADIRQWKEADPDGTSGSLSVDLEPCVTVDPVPEDATLSVSVRLDKDGPFLPLVRNASVVDALDGQPDVALPACS